MRFIKGYWRSFIVCVFITYTCLMPSTGIDVYTFVGIDKIAHFLMYSLLGSVMCWESLMLGVKGWRLYSLNLALPMFCGGMIELIQERWFYPRAGELGDWLADCIGVLVGFCLVMCVRHFYQKKHAKRMAK